MTWTCISNSDVGKLLRSCVTTGRDSHGLSVEKVVLRWHLIDCSNTYAGPGVPIHVVSRICEVHAVKYMHLVVSGSKE